MGSLTVFSRSLRGQERGGAFTFTQYHNQTPASSLHKRLVEMWDAVRTESGGKVACQVFAQNNNIQGSDPAALKALVAGDIQFFTLMGGILGTIMPSAEVQQVPYAFRSAAHAHQAMDGPLGTYLIEEMAAKGIHGFRTGAFDNGMREITSHKQIAAPADLAGLKMRVPNSPKMFCVISPGRAGNVTVLGTSCGSPKYAASCIICSVDTGIASNGSLPGRRARKRRT